jgi:hypothetical protein
MFVRDFLHVGQPFEKVAPRFVKDTTWLVPLAEEAVLAARTVASRMGDGADPGARGAAATDAGADPTTPTRGRVRCEVGPVRVRSDSLLVPLWLVHEGEDPALPDLSGDLEIAPLGSRLSLLAFSATYPRSSQEPHTIRRIERATEAGVRTFLTGIATVLTETTFGSAT